MAHLSLVLLYGLALTLGVVSVAFSAWIRRDQVDEPDTNFRRPAAAAHPRPSADTAP